MAFRPSRTPKPTPIGATRATASAHSSASLLLPGVFSPLLTAGLLLAFWRTLRARAQPETALQLVAFSLPPLILILVQAFISEANANWAATAYIAGTPLAVEVLDRSIGRWTLWATLAFDGIVDGDAVDHSPWRPPTADRIGVGNAFKRQEGWGLLGAAVVKDAAANRYDAIATENRSVVAELLYVRYRSIPINPLLGQEHAATATTST